MSVFQSAILPAVIKIAVPDANLKYSPRVPRGDSRLTERAAVTAAIIMLFAAKGQVHEVAE